MPVVDVEENIKKLQENIDQLTREVFRLQGVLQTFQGFKKGGLTQIDLPNDPDQSVADPIEELESIQEDSEKEA